MSDGPGPTGDTPWEPPVGDRPTFVAPTVPPGAATLPPAPPLPPAPIARATRSGSADESGERGRPLPSVASLVAAIGGIVLVSGLFAILSEPDIASKQATMVAISAAFTAVGAGLVLLNRSRRSAAGGVALAALAVVPLVSSVFQGPDDIRSLFTDPTGYRNTQLAILATLSVVWLVCYRFGPGRRYGLFLGAALVAMWLIPMTYFSTTATADTIGQFSSGTLTLDPGSTSSTDPFGGSSTTFGDPFAPPASSDSLPLKLGLTSLVFGGAYLLAAAKRDADGDARMATPFFAVAPIVLFQALTYLQEDLKTLGTSLLGIALGAVALGLGVRAGRRFTAWIGVASIAFSVVALVSDAFDDASVSTGITLAAIGLVTVLVITWLESEGKVAFSGRGDRQLAPTGTEATPAAALPEPPTLPMTRPPAGPDPGPDAWGPSDPPAEP